MEKRSKASVSVGHEAAVSSSNDAERHLQSVNLHLVESFSLSQLDVLQQFSLNSETEAVQRVKDQTATQLQHQFTRNSMKTSLKPAVNIISSLENDFQTLKSASNLHLMKDVNENQQELKRSDGDVSDAWRRPRCLKLLIT